MKHIDSAAWSTRVAVAPRAGAWIETQSVSMATQPVLVAPRAGAWIETLSTATLRPALVPVAPRAGAWIETMRAIQVIPCVGVAPRAGAWIETSRLMRPSIRSASSPPARGRGLKHASAACL